MAARGASRSRSSKVSKHGMWSSRWLFILAAAGSAVGLGNIWKFPYIAGENGGGAFVVVYLICVGLVGVPIMMGEVLLGRSARRSPINAMRAAVKNAGASGVWVLIGWAGAIAGFLILSYYSVIAGWALYYTWRLASGEFIGADGDFATMAFNDFMGDFWLMLGLHTAFIALTVWIIGRGVAAGLETAIRWFMPLLLLLLLVLLAYSFNSGGFDRGFAFMFNFEWDKLGLDGVLVAMGQAFFTLSLGMGAIMAYGAYVPDDANIGSTVFTIALLDTAVAIAAGLAIFPIVFANGLEPGSGPGLMFVTLPLAFGSMPYGEIFGAIFFVMVSFAAITSAISLTEPALAYLVEEYNAVRGRVAITVGVLSWFIGIGTVLSFNYWAELKLFGLTFFELLDYLTQNLMLPLGGLAIAIFVGYVLQKETIEKQLAITHGAPLWVWRLLIGLIAPLGVITVFSFTIYQTIIAPMLAG